MIPRVVLALDRPTFQRQLKERLSTFCMVDLMQGKQRLWQRLAREVCDLVVVSYKRIPGPPDEAVRTLCQEHDAPELVVLTEDPSPDLRARFLAAGCKAVLEQTVSAGALTEVLKSLLAQRKELAQQRLSQSWLTQPQLSDFVSHSPVMQAFLEVVQRIVASDVSVLVLGETGVGKERLARAIHNDSPRADGPFVAINCGALPETLLESELFGHEEGAFTGATRSRRGCFELAHGGTVFLDEIGELPHHLQVKLLRVLQDREVRRLGGERPLKVDVRIMAATNRDLDQAVAAREFRQDLFYRLNVMSLTLPPLRERREDIPELAISYVQYLQPKIGCDVSGISGPALQALLQYDWPGNVRELINVIERALLLCSDEEISLEELPAGLTGAAPTPRPTQTGLPEEWLELPWREVRHLGLQQLERAYLEAQLDFCNGRVGQTARRAGMQPRSLYQKMRAHGLAKEDFRN